MTLQPQMFALFFTVVLLAVLAAGAAAISFAFAGKPAGTSQ